MLNSILANAKDKTQNITLCSHNNDLNSLGNNPVKVNSILKCPISLIFTDPHCMLYSDSYAEFMVIESLNNQNCVLLGMNVLQFFKCVLNGKENELEIPSLQCSIPLITPILRQDSTSTTVKHLSDGNIFNASPKDIYFLQKKDKILTNLYKFIIQKKQSNVELEELPENCQHFKPHLSKIYLDENDIICHRGKSFPKVVLPKSIIVGVALDCHVDYAHIGFQKL